MIELIKKYCLIPAVSGEEWQLRGAIIENIKPFADTITVDPLGNLIVFKKGKKRAVRRVMLDAHMDEVGLIITGADERGYLRFASVGGIDERVLFGKRVKIGDIYGVIGGCAVHQLESDAKRRVIPEDKLLIDIGADSRKQALELVMLGSTAVFDTPFTQMEQRFCTRALDDRIGCAVLTKLIEQPSEYDMYYSFSVQEEVGCRGAAVAAYTIAPDYAIAVESTTARDLYSTPAEETVCKLSDGAVAAFMDNGTLYDRRLYNAALSCGTAVQSKRAVAGANDSATIHRSRGGVRTLALALPSRYIHSGSCMGDIKDAEALVELTGIMAAKMASGELDD